MFVEHRHKLRQSLIDEIKSMVPHFEYGEFGKTVFYRTYSRVKPDGSMESWNDTVIRVMEGVSSIRKDWYLKHHLRWEPDNWDHYIRGMAISLFNMEWLPPGRGLWAMGSDFVYERGSMALNNCGFKSVGKYIGDDVHWIMDALMCGVGVGFDPERDDSFEVFEPVGRTTFVIPDTREGWCDSVKHRIDCYLNRSSPYVEMDYSQVRPEGLPIKGFGGLSSGPEPLKRLHDQIDEFMRRYMDESHWYDEVLLKSDIVNAVGCCVVAGNVRRSAEIACGSVSDRTFLDLKNYSIYPHRESIGWMSNNSAMFEYDEDFEMLGEIAKRIIDFGEPGVINVKNMKFGRVGRPMDGLRPDRARHFNPCGEQPLEDGELCTLVETCPTKCSSTERWYRACEYATVYASTVTLLPTHRVESNSVMSRNRRIGVSIIDWTGWVANEGQHKVIKYMNEGYDRIRDINRQVNSDAGIPEAIRVTTMKPGGTTPKLVGRPSGGSYPNFEYQIRRIRVAKNSPIAQLMIESGIPYEDDVASAKTLVFEYPLNVNSKAKFAGEVTLWQQAMNLITLQNCWSDNAVSCTLTFRPYWSLQRVINFPFKNMKLVDEASNEFKLDLRLFLESMRSVYSNNEVKIQLVTEYGTQKLKIFTYDPKHEENDLPAVLAAIMPHIKSASFLPFTNHGVYPQTPESGITKEEYEQRISKIKPIDWSKLRNSESAPELYCTGDKCELPQG